MDADFLLQALSVNDDVRKCGILVQQFRLFGNSVNSEISHLLPFITETAHIVVSIPY